MEESMFLKGAWRLSPAHCASPMDLTVVGPEQVALEPRGAGATWQTWVPVPQWVDGRFTLRAAGTGKYLAIADGSRDSAAQLVLADAGTWFRRQKLRHDPAGRHEYALVAQHSNLVLDVREARQTPGADVIQYGFHGGGNQRWRMALEPGTQRLEPTAALDLLGVDGHVALPPLAADFSRGVTVEAWVCYRSFKFWSRICDLGNGQGGDNIVFANEERRPDLTFHVIVDGVGHPLTARGALVPGQWAHLAATVAPDGTAVLYKNGDEVARGRLPLPAAVARSSCFIGKSNWPADEYFDGKLAEFRLWNCARTRADILAGMREQLDGPRLSLVDCWRLGTAESLGLFFPNPALHGVARKGATAEMRNLQSLILWNNAEVSP